MAGLHELKPGRGARKTSRRVGRGHGSGRVKTAGRGTKGQRARSGGRVRPGFEGGQMPLQRRVPKRGFRNTMFRDEWAEVNVETLNRFGDESEVTLERLRERGIVKGSGIRVKILGRGDLQRRLTVRAHAFSRTAKEKIEAAGGKAEVV